MNQHEMRRLAETFRYLRESVKQAQPSEEDCRRLRRAIEAALDALGSDKAPPTRRQP